MQIRKRPVRGVGTPATPAHEPVPLTSRAYVRRAHVLAVAAVASGAAYLAWRVGWTLSGGTTWLNLGLLAVGCYIYVTMLGFLFVTWETEVPARFAIDPVWTVDIFIPTYNETEEILRATGLAAVSVRFPHRTLILDDGRRPAIQRLAIELGCEYVVRADNRHAKAGNLNHALQY